MANQEHCRLIVDPPGDGAWNMAVDEALMEAVTTDQTPTLRIYRWERPTLSLGYFQAYAQRESHPASRDADVVRRLSGGGAILHDQELTYSLIVPGGHPWAADTQGLYNTVHRAIVAWLKSLAPAEASWRLVVNEPRSSKHPHEEQAFLCFQRRAPGDVLLIADGGNHKIVGSAQRRRHGSVLQHGSVLWATSAAAPEVCGFTQLLDLEAPLAEAALRMSADLPALLGLKCELASVSGGLAELAKNKRDRHYKSRAWTQRR